MAIVASRINKRLYVEGCPILEQSAPEREVDLVVHVATDSFGISPRISDLRHVSISYWMLLEVGSFSDAEGGEDHV